MTTTKKKMTRSELQERFKNTPIGEMDIEDVVNYFGEDEILDEVSEFAIAHAIEPSDYKTYHSTSDFLSEYDSEELLDQCTFDEIMQYVQKEGDVQGWLLEHPNGIQPTVSMEDAVRPHLRRLMELARPHACYLSKEEVVEELKAFVNDYWR